ncbi:MAG TPA: anti-sigma factor [Nocardioides sp.]|jgi:anti-sigma-K factor RskA|uniref:anti-sigma factor n=1 Tax=Nocardioides sp. TaxID=35761 RepID=UPI002BA1E49C|nr:anti-sigma factor [Nocardioides sp.]HTW16018.1 anti-sigma factor [Nocardioides sp.]
MTDIHALSGAYAVDALDDLERAQFEKHLAECPACRSEVDSLREAAAMMAETVIEEPPPALRDRVLADIATVRPLPPLVPEQPVRRRPARRWLPGLAAAAAVVTVLGVGAAVVQPWEDETSQTTPSAVDRIRAADDVQTYVQQFEDGSTATLYRSVSLNQAVIATSDMADAPDGRVYEVWLQHDERMVAAGLMPDGPSNVVELVGDPATADGFGITLEADGGSTTGEPEGDVLAVVEFEQA